MIPLQPDLFTAADNPNVDPWLSSRIRQAIAQLCREGQPFTSDEVFERFGIEQPETRAEKNHVGSIIAHAARIGQIREVGRRRSTRAAANGRKVIVWVGAKA